MKSISGIFFTGLAAILPAAITIYILYWLGSAAENRLGGLIKLVIPEELYWTGMGVIVGIALVFGVGLMMKAYVVRSLWALSEAWFARLPLVKTLYGSIRDLMKFASGKDKQLGQVVTVKLAEPNVRALGFLTNEHITGIDSKLPTDMVAVYLPLSYQIGGHTVLVPRTAVQAAEMSRNDAMRFAITAGMVAGEARPATEHKDAHH